MDLATLQSALPIRSTTSAGLMKAASLRSCRLDSFFWGILSMGFSVGPGIFYLKFSTPIIGHSLRLDWVFLAVAFI